MAINFDQRPSGMSKREYAASILGGTKDQYDDSGNKKSTSSSSSKSSSSKSDSSVYKAKSYDYKDFLDTSRVESAFSGAKDTFLGQLTALKPRYEELYKQLEAEKQLSAEKEVALAGKEQTQQKVNLAKRGISVDTDNPFYTTEAGKLEQEQGTRAKETALQFAGKRLDISGAQSADERDLSTAIANLDLNKATTIESLIEKATNLAETRNSQEKNLEYQSKRDIKADEQWEKTFSYTQSKDAADRAMELYKLSKSTSSSNNNAYTSDLGTEISTALTGGYGTGSGIRENIVSILTSKYKGKVDAETIKNDVFGQLGNEWEKRISNKDGVSADKAKESASKALALVNDLASSKGLSTSVGVKGLTGGLLFGKTIPGTEAADFQAKFDSLKSLLTLENMGIMKGVLSDSDMKVITQASTALNRGMSESAFKKELEKVKGVLQSKLGGGNDPLGLGI